MANALIRQSIGGNAYLEPSLESDEKIRIGFTRNLVSYCYVSTRSLISCLRKAALFHFKFQPGSLEGEVIREAADNTRNAAY